MNILNILFLLINILSLDVVLAYIYPMCNRDDAGGCISRNHITEVEVEEGALSTILYIINYVTCSSFMFFKNIFREYFISEDDNLSWKYGRIYSYKPPPSLFETLAIWTGAIYKNSKEDERKWESYKLFMLASSILLSMIFLYYSKNWLSFIFNKKCGKKVDNTCSSSKNDEKKRLRDL